MSAFMRANTNENNVVTPQRVETSHFLTDILYERTRALHVRAERSGIIKDVLRGEASRYGYALFLRNLLPAYQQMEAGLERRPLVPVRSIARRELYRAPALIADLQALYGPEWDQSLPILSAGTYYSRDVAAAAGNGGTRLIAHVYTRYFGDLSGGQILKKLLARKLGLKSRELTFYDFPQVADADVFKHDYRMALNQAAQEITDVDAIVAEAMSAFEHNIAVSEAVKVAAAGQSLPPNRTSEHTK
jgi:heme oxygenase (biliverdin-producing, ferredoxin)